MLEQPSTPSPGHPRPSFARPRRPLVYVTGSYISGIAFCYLFAPPLVPLTAALAAICAVLVHQCLARRFVPQAPFALLLCAVFLAGAIYTHLSFTKTDPLEKQMENGEGFAENNVGHVLSVEQRGADYRVLTLWSEGRKIFVRWRSPDGAPLEPASEDLVGMRVAVSGPVTYPDTARNPGGFDYRLHMLSKNIRVFITCDYRDGLTMLENQPGSSQVWPALGLLAHAKAAFTELVYSTLSPEQAGLFTGMVFGDKEGLDEETYDLFKRHGAAHILSVSGLHIGLIYAFVSALLGRRKTGSFYIAAFILLLCYAALSNFSPSVTRAFLMIVFHIGAMLLNRRYDMLTGVLLSALIILLINPLALFGTGFILSYTAVCSLAFALPLIDRHIGFRNKLSGRAVKEAELKTVYKAGTAALLIGRVLKLLIPVAVIQLSMLPLTLYFFNCFPLMATLVNIPIIALAGFAVPIGFVVLLLSAAGAVLPAGASALPAIAAEVGTSSAGFVIDTMLFLVRAADQIPYSSFIAPSPPLPLIMLFYFGAFFLLSDTFSMWRSHLGKTPAASAGGRAEVILFMPTPILILIACALISTTPMGKYNNALYTFVDVGQGDCLHIRTKDGRNYLMDGGGITDYNIGKNVLAPYLLKNGIYRLDGIFVSHLHMDHFKGLAELAAVIDTGPVFVYEGNRVCPESITCAFSVDGGSAIPDTSLRYITAGDVVLLGGASGHGSAEVLFPPRLTNEEYIWEVIENNDENRTSLLIRFENEGITVLMTGDLSQEGERAAIEVSDISCDILKVAHHGSKNSTSKEFLAATGAKIAVIQVGANTYGHPTRETLDSLAGAGLPVYRNDEDGAILINPAHGGFSIQTVKRDIVSPMLLKPHEANG